MFRPSKRHAAPAFRGSRHWVFPVAVTAVIALILGSGCAHSGPEQGDPGAHSVDAERLSPSECPTTTVDSSSTPPRILNPGDIEVAIERHIPTNAVARSGGTARVMVCIALDLEGRVLDRFLAGSSGVPEADRAALRVAREFRFSPGLQGGESVPWTLVFPVTFTAR